MESSKTYKKPAATREDADTPSAPRRRYESPLRQQQSTETQERIIAAGAELVHQLPTWDWTNLTARAVGERAGVSERTVHRYFPNERKLRDAVLQRLVKESGLSLEALELDDFANIAGGMFVYLSSFAAESTTVPVAEPTLTSMDQQRREALVGAVTRVTPDWPERDRETAAAMLDIFWNLPPYERLVRPWGFDADRAIGAITWMIELINEAIKQGKKPNV